MAKNFISYHLQFYDILPKSEKQRNGHYTHNHFINLIFYIFQYHDILIYTSF